nr:MAG TPA: hypothetical protein [Caudoviricetes sp.]
MSVTCNVTRVAPRVSAVTSFKSYLNLTYLAQSYRLE